MYKKVNLAAKLASFDEVWVPKVVAELNGQLVKVVKFEGEYCWHQHENEDELFWVLAGQMKVLLRDGEVDLGPGEFYVVPRGVEHKPVVPDGICEVVLFEPDTTLNTGDVRNDLTRARLDRI